MAKKMAEEIFRAEKQGETIISDAEKKAREIIDRAKHTATETAERLASEAGIKAEQMAEDALSFADSEKSAAEAEAEIQCRELEKSFKKNSTAAVKKAIDLLIS